MYKTIFLLLLLGHLLGDFYFQSQTLSEQKNRSIRALFCHCGLYAAAVLLSVLPVFGVWPLVAAGIVIVAHVLIDGGKHLLLRSRRKLSSSGGLYLLDQALHLLSVVIGAVTAATWAGEIAYPGWLLRLFATMELEPTAVLSWIVLLLFIWKPANVTIKLLLTSRRPIDPGDATQLGPNLRAGAYIGLLERIIIAMFLAIGQYSAVGLVLTAKSIARYNRIAEDRAFAEYYLLGTLLSTMLVILIHLVVT